MFGRSFFGLHKLSICEECGDYKCVSNDSPCYACYKNRVYLSDDPNIVFKIRSLEAPLKYYPLYQRPFIRHYQKKLNKDNIDNSYSYYTYTGADEVFSGIHFIHGNKYLVSFRSLTKKEKGKVIEPKSHEIRIFVKQQDKDIPIVYGSEDSFNLIWIKSTWARQ